MAYDTEPDDKPTFLRWLGLFMFMALYLVIFATIPISICIVSWNAHPVLGVVMGVIWFMILFGDASQRPL